jgi:hypothetical protein
MPGDGDFSGWVTARLYGALVPGSVRHREFLSHCSVPTDRGGLVTVIRGFYSRGDSDRLGPASSRGTGGRAESRRVCRKKEPLPLFTVRLSSGRSLRLLLGAIPVL